MPLPQEGEGGDVNLCPQGPGLWPLATPFLTSWSTGISASALSQRLLEFFTWIIPLWPGFLSLGPPSHCHSTGMVSKGCSFPTLLARDRG